MSKLATGCLVGLGLCLGLGGAAQAAAAPEELYAAAHAQQSRPDLVMVGTVDADGFPQIRVMSNLRNPEHEAAKLAEADDFTAYAITRAGTDKLAHLAANPHMSMYYQNGGQALLLLGRGEVVTDQATRHAVWEEEFESMGYEDGPDDPALVVLRFTPTHGKLYRDWRQHPLVFPPTAR